MSRWRGELRRSMKRKYGVVAGCLCLAIAAGAAVWFSSQGSVASNGLSKGILYQLMDFFGIEITDESMKLGNFLLRKAAHLTVYFCLGLGLCGAFHWQKRVPAWLPALVLGAIFATTDEFHQLFTGRTAMVKDVLLDSCGVALGCLVASLAVRMARRKHPPKD